MDIAPSLSLQDIAAFYILDLEVPLYKKLRDIDYDTTLINLLLRNRQDINKKHLTRLTYFIAVKFGKCSLGDVPFITRELCEIAIESDGYQLQYVPEHFKTKKLCMDAIYNNIWAVLYITSEVKTKETYEYVVNENGYILKHVPMQFITEEMCLTAVKSNYLAIEFIIEFLPKEILTAEMLAIAIKASTNAFSIIPKHLLTVATLLYIIDYCGIEDIPDELITPELCLELVKSCGDNIKYLNDEFITLEMYKIAVEYNSDNWWHVPNELKYDCYFK